MKTIVSVTFDEDSGRYNVNIPSGSSVEETAFGVSVIIKCLVRDKVIESDKLFTDLVDKYLNDSQYEEIK